MACTRLIELSAAAAQVRKAMSFMAWLFEVVGAGACVRSRVEEGRCVKMRKGLVGEEGVS